MRPGRGQMTGSIPRRIRRAIRRLTGTLTRHPATAVAGVVVLAAVALGVVALSRSVLPWLSDAAAIRAALQEFGPAAPVAFVLVQAGQVILAPVPGQVLGFASGYLFGTIPGTAYSLLGAALGSYVVFRLSRRFGRAYVEARLDPGAVAHFDHLAHRGGLPALFLVFLVPGLPDDAVCFVAGLTDLRIRDMLVVSLAGRLPGYLVVNAAGAQLAADQYVLTGGLVALLLALSLVGYLRRRSLIEWIGRAQGVV